MPNPEVFRMRTSALPGVLALGVVAAAAALLVLRRTSSDTSPPLPGAATVARGILPSGQIPALPLGIPLPRGGSHDRTALEAALAGEPPERVPGVPSGTFVAKGEAGGDQLGVPDLDLTASQRVLIEAVLAERQARMEEIRQQAAKGPLPKEEALQLAEKANAVHVSSLANIRSSLLPEQRTRFDALLGSGTWGRYSFVIPVR
jgi:hypothetical protein